MFNNPVYNLPAQFNENLLPQNLAALSLNSGPLHQEHHHHHSHLHHHSQQQQQQRQQNLDYGAYALQQQQQQQQQHQQPLQQVSLDVGGYAPPSINDISTAGIQWPSPDDVNASYQRGSTVVRQYNNSMIDDYYKKFLRPITDYVAIPTNGQPTYVYQNLGGPASTAVNPTVGSMSIASDIVVGFSSARIFVLVDAASTQSAPVAPESSQSKVDAADEKKHKKKHKKRSSKHAHAGDTGKASDGEKTTADDRYEHMHMSQHCSVFIRIVQENGTD
jgi:hypothetical protein